MISYKAEYWYKELKSHIECVHEDSFKTGLITATHLHLVVTRVNHLTTKLWVEFINQIIKTKPPGKFDQIKKINWIVTQKNYKRWVQNELLKTT